VNLVAISQRVDVYVTRKERRDALDQRWISLLAAANLTPILLPNSHQCAKQLLEAFPIKGIVLTGGNDLVAYGGNAPERDQLELWLMEYATKKNLPLLGVCRGMQIIQHAFDTRLQKVPGHVTCDKIINIQGRNERVNSFHNWGSYVAPEGFNILAIADDKVVKGIVNIEKNITGIMWHPERIQPYREEDIQLLKDIFL
jgi:gamma-glutamyl-gamma-aminobutyrate hydrolase PuuD